MLLKDSFGRLAGIGPMLVACLLVLVPPRSGIAEPRIAPVPEDEWSELQREIAASVPGGVTNAVATYLHNPTLTSNFLPLKDYISGESALAARHRELLILRTAWLCRSDYVWAHRAEAARRAGITDGELALIAHGPQAPGWDRFEAALLRAADELHVDTFISDETWSMLEERYTDEQLVDMVFTVGEFTMIAGTVNSVGVRIEPGLDDRRPYGVPYVPRAEWTNERLIGGQPRIVPLPREEWTPEIHRVLDPDDSGDRIANVYGAYIHSLGMDIPRRRLSEHIRNETTISDWQREVLLNRIGVLGRSEYEWAVHSRIGRSIGMDDSDIERIIAGPAHPDNDSRPVDYALLRATDELFRDDIISSETWEMLAATFDTPQLLDILTTIGGYRMFAMAINTFGVQLDPNMMESRFPPRLR